MVDLFMITSVLEVYSFIKSICYLFLVILTHDQDISKKYLLIVYSLFIAMLMVL